MGPTGPAMIFLSADDVIAINAYMLRYGGLSTGVDNVANRDSLNYLVEAVPGVFFGEELHKGLHRKAAAYAYYIICDHIFHDGNKRTGMEAAFAFLRFNGTPVVAVLPEEVVRMALDVANGTATIDDLAAWLEAACRPGK